jgi:hypothetical protein
VGLLVGVCAFIVAWIFAVSSWMILQNKKYKLLWVPIPITACFAMLVLTMLAIGWLGKHGGNEREALPVRIVR